MRRYRSQFGVSPGTHLPVLEHLRELAPLVRASHLSHYKSLTKAAKKRFNSTTNTRPFGPGFLQCKSMGLDWESSFLIELQIRDLS